MIEWHEGRTYLALVLTAGSRLKALALGANFQRLKAHHVTLVRPGHFTESAWL